MSKKKSRSQKKKFFSNPRFRNKVIKKKEIQQHSEKSSSSLRKRGVFVVLSTAGCKTIPHCSHDLRVTLPKITSSVHDNSAASTHDWGGLRYFGPCLLFGQKENGSIMHRYFACAIYRSDANACNYKALVDDDFNVTEEEADASNMVNGKISEVGSGPIGYGCIPKKLKRIPKSSVLVFCHECVDVFETKHKCPSVIVSRAQLRFPTRLLAAKDCHSGEAFFFSNETLEVFRGVIERSRADGVLCLGTPRLFENLRTDARKDRHLFLLDYDSRYARFFPSRQYGQYSMLVDHFFDRRAFGKLNDFFGECAKVLLVCDPPFGVLIEPLMQTINALKQRHASARIENTAAFFVCLTIPLFVGKHVLRTNNDYWMSDYRVTYDNHKVFSKPSKTTVRCFTNLSAECFDLSSVEGYKFCDFCERYVVKENKHCFMCSSCTSKDGSPYKHCERCMRCVKISYRHCKKCERCHLEGRCFVASQQIDEDGSTI